MSYVSDYATDCTQVLCAWLLAEIPAARARHNPIAAGGKRGKKEGAKRLGGRRRHWGRCAGAELAQAVPADRADGAAALGSGL